MQSSQPGIDKRRLAAGCARALACALALLPASAQQQPAPGGGGNAPAERLVQRGLELLDREDPVAALATFRDLRQQWPQRGDALLGLGNTHLMLGRSTVAADYAEALLALQPGDNEAMALQVRSLIRQRQFDAAVRAAASFVRRTKAPTAELLAARGSSLFRVQRIDEAAAAYRATLVLDRDQAEAHLRLGSGLTPPQQLPVPPLLQQAVAAAQAGDLDTAAVRLHQVLDATPQMAMAHRLLGEVLLQQKALRSMALNDGGFRLLRQRLPPVDLGTVPVGDFLLGYEQLSPARRATADRALCLFARRLPTLIANGAQHDLLLELERTTDAPSRQGLRGKRTFDGRVWDDVRGIGGLHAGTGIEALDEAANFGFDTLVHELTHQVHYYALGIGDRARITRLYEQARDGQRCLDYYAASNEAEYFAQGVEAFAALTKRPGCETTHGHTRFELYRKDPELHDFIAGIVDSDPLADAGARGPLLAAAIDTALRSGRPDDALVAAQWLQPGPYRQRVLAECRAAVAEAKGL